jgi:sigma-B regulation protein RsbU (phosphoserine phosphatase)
MTAPSPAIVQALRPRIIERRARLQAATGSISADYVNDLLSEIDAALERIDDGSYGVCETCHETIEADRLQVDPLTRFCLDHLSAAQLRAHEQDLELATRIQARLLPPAEVTLKRWAAHYRYQAASAVGGDYCELIPSPDGECLFFAVGDVSGKGVAASLLMTHLSAILRSLLPLEMPLADLVARANRQFCESTAAEHYATLACGRARANCVEICNAGHCRPLLLRKSATEQIDSTGLPLGLFSAGHYTLRECRLEDGDSLVFYSDGITEAQDAAGNQFEEGRLASALRLRFDRDTKAIADGVLQDVEQFRNGAPQNDDVTLLIVRRR